MADKKQGNWFARHKVLTVIGAIVALIIIVSTASGGSNNTPTASKPATTDSASSSTSKPTSTAPAAQQTLLDITGSGTKQTAQFTAAGNWDLNWTYDCSSFSGGSGNFITSVFNKDGSPSIDNSDVNQLGAKGADVQHYYKGGTFYLNINSECSWHVTVKG